MAMTPLPTPPARTQSGATFAANADALLSALPQFVTEANALASSLTSLASGAAVAIQYTFSTTTTDADPGNGTLRLSASTQNTSTVIRADLLATDGTDWTAVLDTFDASTSTVKGVIKLVKMSDPTKWLVFNITARAAPTGYRNLTVVNIGSSAANPFNNGDAVGLLFTRAGDKGDVGSSGVQGLVCLATASASSSATVDFTSFIDSSYDEYEIHLQDVIPATATAQLYARTSANAGSSWDSAAGNYKWVVTGKDTFNGPQDSVADTDTQMNITGTTATLSNTVANGGISGTLVLVNPAGTTSHKHFRGAFSSETNANATATLCFAGKRISTSAVNGIRFLMSSGNISSGLFKLYGVRKTV